MDSFETVWNSLQNNRKPGTVIKNWTAFKGFLGDSMTIVGVHNNGIEVDAPKAKNIRVIPVEDFEHVWAVWLDYKTKRVKRYQLRDVTRYSKYIISILHWFESDS